MILRAVLIIILLLTVLAGFSPAQFDVNNIPEPVPPPKEVRDFFELDPFYQQWISVNGFPVVSSAKVNPFALKEAAWLIWQMIGQSPAVLHILADKQIRFTVIGHTEILPDIPEYSDHVDFLTYRIRGTGGGGVAGHIAVTGSEEILLEKKGLYNVLIHEFAHAIHRFGLNTIDPTFDTRLNIAYEAAMANGLWQGTYAASDRREYWAEGTLGWLHPQGGGSFSNYGTTRGALKAYDPGLAALLAEIYGDSDWVYTPIEARLHLPHLQGFNPQNSPTFSPPPELEELYRQFHNPNSDGGDNWVDLIPYDPSLIPILNESRTVGKRAFIGFVNLTQAHISIYDVTHNGTERFVYRIRPGNVRWGPTEAGDLSLIKDPNGKNIAVFQAIEQTGRAIVSMEMSLITPGLSKISGDNQTGISGAALPKPFVVEVRDENLSVLEGISVTFTVAVGSGMLSVTHTTTDENGQAASRFTLGTRLGTNAVEVDAAGLGQSVVFNAVTEAAVNIPDTKLRAAVETALGKAEGEPIAPAEMLILTELNARNADISDLTGIEFATNLTTLRLHNNHITDLSPLSSLTELSGLYLDDSDIADISPLSGLIRLDALGLGGNNISDITALVGLTYLNRLRLDRNAISDISALSGLTQLTELRLGRNSITDLSPLVANTGLGEGDEVDVQSNPLSSLSINTQIPTLQRRGVEVLFDAAVEQTVDTIQTVNIPDPNLRAKIETALGKASGAPITRADMETLTSLAARSVNITVLTGLEYATNLTRLSLYGNSISDISPLAGLTNLTDLFLSGNSISDISAVAGLINLTDLFLSGNSISDFSPLAGLTNLRILALTNNSISDISAVAGLINLTWLTLEDNSISDISPLTGLTNLTTLSIGQNSISDISAVAGLINLTWLGLTGNSISDISPLTGLTNLTDLFLSGNSISDLSAVAGLIKLTDLDLSGNSISDISPLTELTNLTTLHLSGNSISDISPLVANTGLGEGDTVDVSANPLNDASINVHLPALRSRGVTDGVKIPDPNLRAAVETALGKAPGDNITVREMANLSVLQAESANINDLTGLEFASDLRVLILWDNSISDISPLTGLTNLTTLVLANNSISDISAVAGLINLTGLHLGDNGISDISPLTGLTNLIGLHLYGNSISDLSAVAGLINLTDLGLSGTGISDISPLTELTNLTTLFLTNNSISDISPLTELTNLTGLHLSGNSISDISPLTGLTNLTTLSIGQNSISDLSAVAGLTHLTWLYLEDNSISDISPLVANTELGAGDEIDVSANPLNDASINVHLPALLNRGVEVRAENLKPTTSEYTLSIPKGLNLIHVPLKVTEVDGVAKTIESIADLYDALGGAGVVNFLITYDSRAQEWLSYFSPSDRGGSADVALADTTGIIVGMLAPASVQLSGTPLGMNGNSPITLTPGLNLVGLPLRDSRIARVSDLLNLDGIYGNVPVIILTDGGDFKAVGRAGDPGDIPITGGQGFILTAQQAATVTLSGEGWTRTSSAASASPLAQRGIQVADSTAVLVLSGAVVDEGIGLNNPDFRVTVKNLSTDRAVAGMTAPGNAGYRFTVVDIETQQAARIGDTLEISAQSLHPFIGVQPLRYTVTAEDVRRSRIQLPELVAYYIPKETQLLTNYPNPFNPETWIPYRLAEDALVSLTIYDQSGQVVRTIDVGHRGAAVYESRDKAIYWDGRNEFGEQVASGVFFYHLSAGGYSATRKMLILK